MELRATRGNPVLAFVSPFVLYLAITSIEKSQPLGLSYEVVCTLKGVITAAALFYFWRNYTKFSFRGFGLATVSGVLGCAVWIGLEKLQMSIPAIAQLTEQLMGKRAGFNPYADGGIQTTGLLFVVVRLTQMVVIVPLAEEVFWRGFLARYLVAEDFQSVPEGKFTPFSFVAVTLAFASVHPEILAALVWGAMINLVYGRTKNLWACILMHAVTNGLLAAYVLSTGSWQLW